MRPPRRKARALISAALVMLASLVPSLAPGAARAQDGAGPVVTVRDAGTEAFLRAIAHPPFRAAGMAPALVRITLVQARPINAFATTGNRMFINTGLIRRSGGRRGRRRRAGARDRRCHLAAGGNAQRAVPPSPACCRAALRQPQRSRRGRRPCPATCRRGRIGGEPPARPRERLHLAAARHGAGPAPAGRAISLGEVRNARYLARRADRALPPGSPGLRAQDLREAAGWDTLTTEQREQDDAMRRRSPR